jgi:2-keto-4-pentenoate hydratase/2-oxohepta-3-ene-1,7-dioic acid hydratase in catechol pathway
MRICRFDEGRLGVIEGDAVADVSASAEVLGPLNWPVPPGDHAIRGFSALRAEIERLLPGAPRRPLADVRLLSPVANPSKVIAAPLNYALHTDEVGADAEIHANSHATTFAGYATPIEKLGLFLKATTSVVGAGEGVRLAFGDRRNDHEVELAVVIGEQAKDVAPTEALDIVAGYCIGLDMTVRGPEDRSMRKSADTYTVLGPWLVTRDEIEDPDALVLSIEVDGEPRQEANTAALTVGIRELIALASRWYTLYPGDVILTGTPEGVAAVNPGQTMRASVERIGEMQVRVI